MTNSGQFPKGTSGNRAGRPPGSRNRATLAIEALLDGEAEALMRKATELALAGDIPALRLCIERIHPPRKERLIHFDVGPIQNAEQAREAMHNVFRAVGEGQVTPREGELLVNMIVAQASLVSTADLERRVEELEQRYAKLFAHRFPK